MVRICPSELPDATQKAVDFTESSFFKKNKRLPTPAEVRALSPDHNISSQPDPVRFDSLNLIVKFGYHVSTVEAQSLWIIRKTLRNKVPVPEVYGWRVDNRQVFIYMELIRGETLKNQWISLSNSDKDAICEHLRRILTSLREVEQDPSDPFVGSINRQAILDIVFEGMPPCGPFKTVQSFHDYISQLVQRHLPDSEKFEDPYRYLLPDDSNITLTHGDLHRSNILVSSSGPPRVLAIIDWAHCGWYPDYWEYCKVYYTAGEGPWTEEWVPKFLDERKSFLPVFSEYTMWIGAV